MYCFVCVTGDFYLSLLSSCYIGSQQVGDSLLKLVSTLISHSIEQVVILPTRENNILDIIFCSQILSHDKVLNLPPFSSSDHYAIF